MDTYDTTLPTAERDRRERLYNTALSVAMKLREANRLAQQCADEIAPDDPLCNAVCDAAAAIDNAVGEVAAAGCKVEGGRYADAWDRPVGMQPFFDKLKV